MKLALATWLALAAGASAFQGTTTRVSVSTGGAEGDETSWFPSISANGRVVAFTSRASNLVSGDWNSRDDTFVHDRQTGTTERVSVSTSGAEGNDTSGQPSISADGRFVSFWSYASNLVVGTTNGSAQVFLRDRQSGTTEIVSVSPAGAEGNFNSGTSSISSDGRFVAFHSGASNFVAGDTNWAPDVFVRDRQNGTIERASVATGGAEGNGGSLEPAVSADGRFVAFTSGASNLVAGDTNSHWDIFVRDRQSGTTERASVATGGAEGNSNSTYGWISADGRFVAFTSSASNLVAGDTNGMYDVLVRDRQNDTTERASVDSAGAQGNLHSDAYSISADGRFVAFTSGASNLVAGDTNSRLDIFVRDRQSGTTERVSVSTSGVEGDSYCQTSSISSDGRFVAFNSASSNLVAGDANGLVDIFVRDRGLLPPTVYCTSGTTSNGCTASIAASANPNVAHSTPCQITISNVEGQRTGIVFYALSPLSQSWCSAGGGTSFVCVKAPTQRTFAQNSGGTQGRCDGSLALDWNAFQLANPLALGAPWIAGAKAYVQGWFRDPPSCKTTSLSNAVELTYQP